MTLMKKASNLLKTVEQSAMIILLVMLIIVSAMQILFRLVLHDPLFWAEEACRYLFVYAVFIGGAHATSKGSHFMMDFLTSKMPPVIKKIMLVFSYLCCAYFAVILFRYGISIMNTVKSQISPALGISMSIPYSAMPVSAGLILIHLIENTVMLFTNGKEAETA